MQFRGKSNQNCVHVELPTLYVILCMSRKILKNTEYSLNSATRQFKIKKFQTKLKICGTKSRTKVEDS